MKNEYDKVGEMVESYINGNISDFRKWLKKTKKNNIPIVIEILDSYSENLRGGKNGSLIVYNLLS